MKRQSVKLAPFRIKAVGPEDGMEDGRFEAYASVFGNIDSYGDIVEKGAFTRTLGEWADKGNTIPVLWGHDMSDPFANIGGVVEASEDDHGLKIIGQLDLDNPTAAQVHRLLKGRRTNTMSFAYSVRDSEKKDDGFHLRDLDLFEVSIVQVPANELAEVTVVKSAVDALAKAGRVLSAKNEQSLREARDSIDSVLSSLGDDGDGKAAHSGGAKSQGNQASGTSDANADASAEEPFVANASVPAEEQKSAPSVSDLAAKLRIYALMGQEERV